MIFNLTNSIVGAGAIGLGGAMAQSGILLLAYLAKVSLDLANQLSVTTDQDSYEAPGQAANEALPTMEMHVPPTREIHVPPQSSDREQMSSWTYDALYQTEITNNPSTQLYGESDEERKLRRWLNDHRLPQSVGDKLVEVGARDVKDVAMIMDQCKEYLQGLKRLDLIKLKKALETSKSQLEGS